MVNPQYKEINAASQIGREGSIYEFYKSMTTYHDSSVWQDVYRHKADVGMLYIKLTVIDDVLVVSFKEL